MTSGKGERKRTVDASNFCNDVYSYMVVHEHYVYDATRYDMNCKELIQTLHNNNSYLYSILQLDVVCFCPVARTRGCPGCHLCRHC
jgi:hypothetical protein